MQRSMVALALAVLAWTASAQVPTSELSKPPANARHFVIQSVGGKHGDSWSWTGPDGARMGRESMNLRGQVFELDSRGTVDADGMPVALTIRGVTPQGDAGETFSASGGTARWKSPVDGGSVAYSSPSFYVAQGGPVDATAWFLEAILARPDKTLTLLPAGKAHATRLTDLRVGTGQSEKTITLWAITGTSTSPTPMWSDSNNKFFAISFYGIAWLPDAYAGEQSRIEAAQAKALAAQSPELVRTLVTVPRGPVAVTGVRLFDSDATRFLTDQTVVIDKGVITGVGPRSTVRVPAGAQVIDGSGKTLVPGLWDCHMHVGDDFTGVQELSLGVTSVRDPGNDDVRTIDRRQRAEAGELLFPHVYASSLIDGKGPYTAQVANVATSQAEAIALVDKAKANGFTGVKFYGTFNPAWLRASITEAHKLGLHVHGHIPAGIRPMDAIADGYDEITHINWIIMQAMPDSVIAASNGMMRFEGPGRYGKDVDLDGPAIKSIVSTMASRHIYSDPTMVAFEGLYVPENGELSPSYAPFVGTMPPTTERGFRNGGFAVPKDLTRADYRASWAKMVRLLGQMHKAGVPIVAGTDGSGIEIVRELEIYVQAGFSPAEALAAATIVPARLVGMEQKTGSIKVGKTADLALVEGDPSTRVGDLRQTRLVFLEGRLLDADALRTAAGFSGRPKSAAADQPRDSMLVSTRWLAEHLHDPGLVLLHVGERKEFEAAHLPGAQYLPLDAISVKSGEPALTLQLPPLAQLVDRLEALGISNSSRIVIYFGKDWVSPTTRVYFTLDYAGLGGQASVLDGGLPAWAAEGRPVTTEVTTPARGHLDVKARPEIVADAEWVRANLANNGVVLVDSRLPRFYDGDPGSMPRGGHIPGARNVPFSSLVTDDNRFKDTAALKQLLADAGATGAQTVVTYCHIGQQATVDYFAARLLGYPAKLYDGSFEDWSRRADWPVETAKPPSR